VRERERKGEGRRGRGKGRRRERERENEWMNEWERKRKQTTINAGEDTEEKKFIYDTAISFLGLYLKECDSAYKTDTANPCL
jgi:hypothetical protein